MIHLDGFPEPVSEPGNPQPETVLEQQVARVLEKGHLYAKAILSLCPELEKLEPIDTALGIEVGAGADVVAFSELGFESVVCTQGQTAAYAFASRGLARAETEVYTRILQEHSPKNTLPSNLSISDFHRQSRRYRLITMLGMSPTHFWQQQENEGDQGLKQAQNLTRLLSERGVLVMSSMGDQPNSELVFAATANKLKGPEINCRLYIDSQVPEQAQVLGSRILVVVKNNN